MPEYPPQIRERTVAKARILLEALPYMREHYGKVVVIKYGGAAMAESALAQPFVKDIALLRYAGIIPVVVHGGGPQLTEVSSRMGLKTKFVFYIQPVVIRGVVHPYAVVDVLDFIVLDTISIRFEYVNCALGCDNQPVARLGKVLHNGPLMLVGIIQDRMQINNCRQFRGGKCLSHINVVSSPRVVAIFVRVKAILVLK